MRPEVSVAIVGGGITGLATAYYLERAAQEEGWELNGVLVEQEPRLGGKLLTLHEEDFLVEGGPDSFLTQKPWAIQLAGELGIDGDLVVPQTHQAFLFRQGRLHLIPKGIGSGIPTRPLALWRAGFLSWRGKARASLEPFVRPRWTGDDEPLGTFLRRRLGAEVAQRLAEPLAASVYAGDAQRLSLRALYPALAEWGGRYGGLTRGLRAAARSQSAPASPFTSLAKGMASLPLTVASQLRRFTTVVSKRVVEVTPKREGDHSSFLVALDGGDTITADCVVLAVPAYSAAALLHPSSPQVGSLLGQMTFASTASISLAFRREEVAHPLDGSGFLAPRTEACPITACTWTSSKWLGRATEGRVLLRAFMGWAGDGSSLEMDDPEMVRLTMEALRPLLGLRGDPDQTWVHRWPQAMPQYQVGHLGWLDAVERTVAQCPGLFLTGASYRGIGVPDCIRQAQETAQRVREVASQRFLQPTSGM